MTAPPASGSSGGSRVPAYVATGASVVSAVLSASFFYLGYRQAPPLDRAAEVNAWNSATSRDAALGWTFGVVAVAVAVVAVLVAPP
ncbi:MAG: hypothetical protein IPJ65_15635 [Archangiaceae bacterium]|nr:hypothetical protein [Archangiaceae bacterium]